MCLYTKNSIEITEKNILCFKVSFTDRINIYSFISQFKEFKYLPHKLNSLDVFSKDRGFDIDVWEKGYHSYINNPKNRWWEKTGLFIIPKNSLIVKGSDNDSNLSETNAYVSDQIIYVGPNDSLIAYYRLLKYLPTKEVLKQFKELYLKWNTKK